MAHTSLSLKSILGITSVVLLLMLPPTFSFSIPSQSSTSLPSILRTSLGENPYSGNNVKLITVLTQVKQMASDTKIIKLNKDLNVMDGIVAGRRVKFDTLTVKGTNVWIKENMYSKQTEVEHIKAKHLVVNQIGSLNTDSSIIIKGKLIVDKLGASEEVQVNILRVNGINQWQVIENEDFEQDYQSNQENIFNDTSESGEEVSFAQHSTKWSTLEMNSCDELVANTFNGGYCKVSSQSISKTFQNLPPHQQVKLSAVLHAFDGWEGEKLFVEVNGHKVWAKQIDNINKKGSRKSVCGSDQADTMNIKFEKILLSSEESLKLTFGSDLQKDACYASFAIDDISLSIR